MVLRTQFTLVLKKSTVEDETRKLQPLLQVPIWGSAVLQLVYENQGAAVSGPRSVHMRNQAPTNRAS